MGFGNSWRCSKLELSLWLVTAYCASHILLLLQTTLHPTHVTSVEYVTMSSPLSKPSRPLFSPLAIFPARFSHGNCCLSHAPADSSHPSAVNHCRNNSAFFCHRWCMRLCHMGHLPRPPPTALTHAHCSRHGACTTSSHRRSACSRSTPGSCHVAADLHHVGRFLTLELIEMWHGWDVTWCSMGITAYISLFFA